MTSECGACHQEDAEEKDYGWRPADWQNKYGDEWFMSACDHQYALGEAFEDGASAMLKALKAKGKRCPVCGVEGLETSAGAWVFIPDTGATTEEAR